MLPEIETLLILQERDQRLRRLREELARAPAAEAQAHSRLADREVALIAAKDLAVTNELAMKKLEMDIETRKTSIIRLKQQQFETRKNEEYRALEHEVERYGNEVTKLEDEELVLMEKAEELKKTIAVAQAALATTKKRVEEELAQLSERKANADAQIGGLEAERKGIAANVDVDLLFRYERIFDKKAPAVVPLDNGICGGCHMKLTASTLTTTKAAKSITSCEQCGRILYFGQ
ncbi:MAG: zinc ribbon domain-containing protein [Verrucomicrobiales bacterium]